MWPGAYVAVKQTHIYDCILNSSLKEFMRDNEVPPPAIVYLIIPESAADSREIMIEYQFWSDGIEKRITEHLIPRLVIEAWIIEDTVMVGIDDFFMTTELKTSFLENEFGYMAYHFGYDEKTLKMISFEDYKKRRTGN